MPPSADQVQRAFIRKQKKLEKQRLKEGYQQANHLGISNLNEITDLLKNESKQFIEDLKDEFEEAKKLITEKKEEPEEIELKNLQQDEADIESENTIYFDRDNLLEFDKPETICTGQQR